MWIIWSGIYKDHYVFIGPIGVRALPLAAGINVGGHYKWHFAKLSSAEFSIILTARQISGRWSSR